MILIKTVLENDKPLKNNNIGTVIDFNSPDCYNLLSANTGNNLVVDVNAPESAKENNSIVGNDFLQSLNVASETLLESNYDHQIFFQSTPHQRLVELDSSSLAPTESNPSYEVYFSSKSSQKTLTEPCTNLFENISLNGETNSSIPDVINDSSHGDSSPSVSLQFDSLISSTPIESSSSELNISTEKRKKRRNFCIFCEKLVTNFMRHLLAVHVNETDVLRLASLPKKSKERVELSETIRKRGNFIYSTSADGKLLPERRSFKILSPEKKDVVFCSFCNGLYTRRALFRHLANCSKNYENKVKCQYCEKEFKQGALKAHLKFCPKKGDKDSEKEKEYLETYRRQNRVLQSHAVSTVPHPMGASEDLSQNVLSVIRDDHLGLIAKNDPLILAVGSKLRSNHREDHLKSYISVSMRDLARVCEQMEKLKCSSVSLEDCLKSENCSLLLKSIQNICRYDPASGHVAIPSMPSRLSPSIYLAFDTIINNLNLSEELTVDEKKRILFDYESSKKHLQTEWRFSVSANVEKSRKENDRNKEVLLPLPEDVKTALTFLEGKENKLYDNLSKKPTLWMYEQMCETLITDIIIFNCRRAGETARILLKDFLNRDQSRMDENLKSMFSEVELEAKTELTMFEIPGKRGRDVSVFLTKSMKKCVDLIIAVRKEFSAIDKNNKFLFARPYSKKPYNGCSAIRKLKQEVKLKKPECFTPTGLRHKIATFCQVGIRDPSFVGNLAMHMGLEESIHHKNYRFPVRLLHHCKVGSKLIERRKALTAGTSFEKPSSTLKDFVTSNDLQAEQALNRDDNYSIHSEKKSPMPENNLMETSKEEDDISEDSEFSSKDENLSSFSKQKKKKTQYRPWCADEKAAIVKHFSEFFKRSKNPGKMYCTEIQKKESALKNRTWAQINVYVDNIRRNKISIPEVQVP